MSIEGSSFKTTAAKYPVGLEQQAQQVANQEQLIATFFVSGKGTQGVILQRGPEKERVCKVSFSMDGEASPVIKGTIPEKLAVVVEHITFCFKRSASAPGFQLPPEGLQYLSAPVWKYGDNPSTPGAPEMDIEAFMESHYC